jgi:cytoskeletal protein CcmA (bactofilin family)
MTAAPRAPTPAGGRPSAVIGPTIRIKGDMSGDEDLLVEGLVEGTMELSKNQVTVGKEGRINAAITARLVEVEGRIDGDITGHEQVVLRRSGQVRGNIAAPRVTLEDGCRFKGSIDMDVDAAAGKVAGISTGSAKNEAAATAKSAAGKA